MSEEPSTTETVTAVVWAPSMAVSSTPVTVTVWALFQFELVNVNWVGDTVTSPVSADVKLMTTSPAGWESRTTENVAVVPDSATDSDVVDNVNPGLSVTAGARFPDESNFETQVP